MAIGCRGPDRETRRVYESRIAFVFLADETLRLEIEHPGVAGVIGRSIRPTSPAGGYGL
jgi:hypothetical protein